MLRVLVSGRHDALQDTECSAGDLQLLSLSSVFWPAPCRVLAEEVGVQVAAVR